MIWKLTSTSTMHSKAVVRPPRPKFDHQNDKLPIDRDRIISRFSLIAKFKDISPLGGTTVFDFSLTTFIHKNKN